MSQASQGIRELDRESYISLATFRRNGKAVLTPVWFAESGGCLYVFSEADAGKVKRLRNGSRIRVAACNVRGKVHGAWHEGEGRRANEPETVATAYAALHRKYGLLMKLTDFFSRLTGRFDGRAILELRLES